METKQENQRFIKYLKLISLKKKIRPVLDLSPEIRRKNNAGFTLIELLVVIAIIGLLASVVLVALNGAREKSREAKRVADINQLGQAMELFFNDHNSYPTTGSSVALNAYGVLSASSAACGASTAGCVNYLVPTYLTKIPLAPVPADNASGSTSCSGSYGGGSGIGNDYQYAGTGGAATVNNYTITFCLGGTSGSFGPGVHTATQGGLQ